jgi:hypothetical protein
MPPGLVFDDNAAPPCWDDRDDDNKIELGTQVRIRLIGARPGVNEMICVGSINGDYLGYAQVYFLPHFCGISVLTLPVNLRRPLEYVCPLDFVSAELHNIQ